MAIFIVTNICFHNATPFFYITFQNSSNDLKKAQFGQDLIFQISIQIFKTPRDFEFPN
jgi:hypothetical protein